MLAVEFWCGRKKNMDFGVSEAWVEMLIDQEDSIVNPLCYSGKMWYWL